MILYGDSKNDNCRKRLFNVRRLNITKILLAFSALCLVAALPLLAFGAEQGKSLFIR
jgi:hypothetical protein